jgi:hypothetical protein
LTIPAVAGGPLQTFANPSPSAGDGFGAAAVQGATNVIAIGSPGDDFEDEDAGRVYVYDVSSPIPIDVFSPPKAEVGAAFGYPIAALGNQRFAVGADLHDAPGATNAGIVYLFHASGDLLGAFADPAPQTGDQFGLGLADIRAPTPS